MAKVAQVRFRKQELTRAIRAVTEGGQQVSAIQIDSNGQVSLQIAQRKPTADAEEQPTAA